MSRLAWIVVLSLIPLRNLPAIDDVLFSADAIVTDLFQARKVELAAHWLDAGHLSVTLTAAALAAADFNTLSSISITCAAADYRDNRLRCADGELTYAGANGARQKTGIRFEYGLADRDWRIRIDRLDLDLAQFPALPGRLQPAFKNYHLGSGRWRGVMELQGRAGDVTAVTLKGDLSDLTLAGASTLEAVAATVELGIARNGATWSVDAAVAITAGAMYIVPGMQVFGDTPGFYIEAGAKPLTLNLAAAWDTEHQRLAIDKFKYTHPGLLRLEGSAVVLAGDTLSVPALSLNTRIDRLEKTYAVYIQPLLLNTNFGNLETAGNVVLTLDYSDQRLRFMDLHFKGIYLDDGNDRFSLARLTGNLSLRDDEEPMLSNLSWDGLSFHRLDFGPGSVMFESVGERVNVLRWEDVAVLDGKLAISNLDMRDIGSPDFTVTLDARLTAVSMQAFTQAMQWPLMSGTLSGEFQGLTYSRNNLQLNGAVGIQVFAGAVTLNNLLVTDVISDYSRLSADIALQGLDLEQLTDTFAFGKIAGTLNGQLRNLRLENWRPVYFEAEFLTPAPDERPHRISQKALENLNSLGGGLSGTMSRGFIRFFPEYSYGQIGLRCRLNHNTCELGGVSETAEGFYLLTQGGLLPPWVEVKGAGRSIPWDDLIGGLKQIAQGEMRIE